MADSAPRAPPHDFRDARAHTQWRLETEKWRQNAGVPAIPADLSGGSRAASSSNAVLQKAVANPLVPIGMVLTTGCLIGMLLSSLKGKSMRSQYFMRGRIAAQGFTVAALVGGAWIAGSASAGATRPKIPDI